MTSKNYLKISGRTVQYGVESGDDEQAFRESCLVTQFIDSSAEWWTQANFSQRQFQNIKKYILKLCREN